LILNPIISVYYISTSIPSSSKHSGPLRESIKYFYAFLWLLIYSLLLYASSYWRSAKGGWKPLSVAFKKSVSFSLCVYKLRIDSNNVSRTIIIPFANSPVRSRIVIWSCFTTLGYLISVKPLTFIYNVAAYINV
jgi:hypothetical protein